MRLAEVAIGVSSGRVEVAKRHMADPVGDFGTFEHSLDHKLGIAVGVVGRAGWSLTPASSPPLGPKTPRPPRHEPRVLAPGCAVGASIYQDGQNILNPIRHFSCSFVSCAIMRMTTEENIAELQQRGFCILRDHFSHRWGEPSINIFGNDYPTPDGTCIRDYVHVSQRIAAFESSDSTSLI
jgi:hypothetical protein